ERERTGSSTNKEGVDVSVVAAAELDDHVASGRRAREPDGCHRGLSPRRHEAHLLERRNRIDQELCELYLDRRRSPEACAALRALRDGCDNRGRGVTQNQRPPRPDEVQKRAAIGIKDVRATATDDEGWVSPDCAPRANGTVHPSGDHACRPIEELRRGIRHARLPVTGPAEGQESGSPSLRTASASPYTMVP